MKHTDRSSKPRKSSVQYLTAGLAVATAIGLGVSAVQAGGWGSGHGAMMGQSGHMNTVMARGQSMQAGQFVEGRLAFLKTELEITDAQQDAWNTFAEAMRTRAKNMQSGVMQHGAEWQQSMHGNNTDQSGETPIEHMQSGTRHMTERTALMQTGLETMKSLYSVLTPEQQGKANILMNQYHMM